jgi:hypothetical protein
MQPHAAERRHLERQISYARLVFLVLALAALLLDDPPNRGVAPISLLISYLVVALGLERLQRMPRHIDWRVPLVVDLSALGILLLLSRSIVPFWLLFLFVAWTAGVRWGLQRSIELAAGVTAAVMLHAALNTRFEWSQLISWMALLAGTFTAGVGLSFLGDRYRRQAAEHALLARLIGMLQVEQGIAESLRLVLQELAGAFECEKALLAFRDSDLERVFLWMVTADQQERISPQTRPLAQADSLLINRPNASVCWNRLDPPGGGFGWDRRDGRKLEALPMVPETARKELNLSSFMSVTMDYDGQPVGRIMLCNGRSRWYSQDLHWFERAVHHLSLPLNNVFLLRHMRARAIEGERSAAASPVTFTTASYRLC